MWKIVKFRISYLRLPIDGNIGDVKAWDLIVTKMEKWLAGWKRSYLPKGAGSILFKLPYLIPQFLFFLFPVPGFAKRIKIQCWFMWGDMDEPKKYHLVA